MQTEIDSARAADLTAQETFLANRRECGGEFYCEKYHLRMSIDDCKKYARQSTQNSFKNYVDFSVLGIGRYARQPCQFCKRNSNRRENKFDINRKTGVIEFYDSPTKMTQYLREKLQETERGLGVRLGTTQHSIHRWLNGDTPNSANYKKLRELYFQVRNNKSMHVKPKKDQAAEVVAGLVEYQRRTEKTWVSIAKELNFARSSTLYNWKSGRSRPHSARIPGLIKFLKERGVEIETVRT